jgi:hypothetical protein
MKSKKIETREEQTHRVIGSKFYPKFSDETKLRYVNYLIGVYLRKIRATKKLYLKEAYFIPLKVIYSEERRLRKKLGEPPDPHSIYAFRFALWGSSDPVPNRITEEEER